MADSELKDNVDADIQKRLITLSNERAKKRAAKEPTTTVTNEEDVEPSTSSTAKKRKSKDDGEFVSEFNIKEVKNKER